MAQTKTATRKKTAKKASPKTKTAARKTAKKKAPASKTPAKRTAKTAAKKKTSRPKAASTKQRAAKSANAKSAKKKPAGEQEVTIDRRRNSRRQESDKAETAASPKLERRQKVNRRRQIDPTTCEREYNEAEVEFMNALDEYKRKSGRMFPTCSEVLEVIVGLGYVKLSPAEMAQVRPEPTAEGIEDEAAEAAQEALELSDEVRVGEPVGASA